MSTVDNLLAGAFGPLTDEQTKWVKKLTHHTANLEKLLYETLNMVKAQMESSAVLEVLEKKIATPLVTPGLDYTPASHVSTSLPVSTGIVPKVLAIDDESDILDVIQEGLKMKGFETIGVVQSVSAEYDDHDVAELEKRQFAVGIHFRPPQRPA
jgi:hypothetical protein